ncbi:MAG TPA: ComEA family DNA-binding protein [Dehalococcoidia bacterium]|jgi:competence protein ComEA|nr:ComEA family DNA-binding protein [Dehalococcoidia bacterium]
MSRRDAVRWALFVLSAVAFLGLTAATLVGWWQDRRGGTVTIRSGELPETGRPIVVYVTGAVARPGVYTLRDGDRVEQAVAAAGGFAEDADPERINLARRLRDEDQVTVPRSGQPLPAPTDSAASPAAPLDLNVATAAQLEALPGIGEVYASRIVESRATDGPFASPDDLVARKLIPAATLERIRPYVVAGVERR